MGKSLIIITSPLDKEIYQYFSKQDFYRRFLEFDSEFIPSRI